MNAQQEYLHTAQEAANRRDYLSLFQNAMRAMRQPNGERAARCEAQMLLAQAALVMNLPEEALAFAVGAHLDAAACGGSELEERAGAVVARVIALHPHLREERSEHDLH